MLGLYGMSLRDFRFIYTYSPLMTTDLHSKFTRQIRVPNHRKAGRVGHCWKLPIGRLIVEPGITVPFFVTVIGESGCRCARQSAFV